MASLGLKKRRTFRASTLRPGIAQAGRADEVFADRGLVLRMAMGLLAVLALLFATEAWKPPFAYRLGDHVENGIAAGVDFKRVNPSKTERAKAEKEERVPYIFRHDPAPLRLLPAKLRASLSDVAESESVDDLSPETRSAFGLTAVEPGAGNHARTREAIQKDYAKLRAHVAPQEGTTGTRIDDLIAQFDQFIAPLKTSGIADPAELQANQIRSDRPIKIVSPGDADSADLVSLAEVQLSEVLKDTGKLGKEWETSYSDLWGIKEFIERWLRAQAPVTLRYDRSATQSARREARDEVQAITDDYIRGDLLVPPGQIIDASALAILQAQHNQLVQQAEWGGLAVRSATVFLLLSVLAALNAYYLVYYKPQVVRRLGRLGIYLAIVVVTVVLARLLSYDPWRAEIIPLTAAVMVIAIAYDQEFALLAAFTLTLIITLSTTLDIGQFVVLMSVSATAVVPLSRVSSRSTLTKVGLLAAAAYFLISMGMGIIESRMISQIWTDTDLLVKSLKGAGLCLLSSFMVAGSLPFIESVFGVVTNISLLEMSDVSHPLLQELVRRAPGTYNHSIAVATIGEAAAERIGANGLLVRVGAYFHDIGKMLKPHYFVENMSEGTESRHEHLAPAMSTLIIIGHVKDGVDLARQHNLPQALIDFIEQHHGTTLVEYFYHAATKQAEFQPDHKTDAEESSFRYPGPKPQTREAGVMMLADAVESASRTLVEPTPKRIERLVHEITLKRLLDGQFDQCTLTLNEIRVVEDSLTKSLIGIYHGRIKYPEQRTA